MHGWLARLASMLRRRPTGALQYDHLVLCTECAHDPQHRHRTRVLE